MRFIKCNDTTCSIPALKKEIQTNAEENTSRVLVNKRTAEVNDSDSTWFKVLNAVSDSLCLGLFAEIEKFRASVQEAFK